MADISKIQIESGTYDIKDEICRTYNILTFDNVNDLKSSTILESGKVIKTLGYYNIGDGGNGKYLIRDKELSDTPNDKDIIAITNDNTIVAEYINDKQRVNPLVFGAKGDGTTDDTTALQFTFDYAKDHKLEIYIPTPEDFYKITDGLTIQNGVAGLIAEKYDYYGIIRGYGSDYTMLTIEGNLGFYCKNLSIGGHDRNTINGIIYEGHTGLNIFEHIRIWDLSGYGFKINAIYDSVLTDISVEKCGNSSEYAFSMNNDSDTCNMTNINRLQVEQAYEKAIFIDSGTLNCVFTNIHSERLNYTNDSNYAWSFNGDSCIYNGMRLTANNNSGDSKNLCYINGNKNKYNDIRIDSHINISYESANNLEINNSQIYSAIEIVDQIGTVVMNNCKIDNITVRAYTTINDSIITNCYFGSNYTSDGSSSKLYNCYVTILNQNDNHCRIFAQDCIIGKLVTDSVLYGEIVNCKVNSLIKINGTTHDKIAYSTYSFYNSEINSDIGLDGSQVIIHDCKINGNFYWQWGGSGNWYSLVNNVITGTVTGFNTAPTQTAPKLTKTDNLQPTSSSSRGWIYDGANWISYN